jgi:hypothetical protein
MTETRVPAGVPTGGQFAAQARHEAAVALGAPTATVSWTERADFDIDRHEHVAVTDTVAVAANRTEVIVEHGDPSVGHQGGVTHTYSGQVAFRAEDEIEDGIVVTSPAGDRFVFVHTGDSRLADDAWGTSRPAAGHFFHYDADAPGGRGSLADDAVSSPVLDGIDWTGFDHEVASGSARDFEPQMWRVVRDGDGSASSLVVVADFSADVTPGAPEFDGP